MIREVYSGLTLKRPNLTRLRQWLVAKEVDAVVIYSSDRFSRDGYDFLTLIRDCERATVELLCVTEPLQDGDIGELLSYVRGWASKQEAQKIRERTMRGARKRAEAGKIPLGGTGRCFGYHYNESKGGGDGRRRVNEYEASVVRQIFTWFAGEGMSQNEITRRLQEANLPTPLGASQWRWSTVHYMLSNPAYIGQTYVFTKSRTEASVHHKAERKLTKTGTVMKPREDWIEVAGATPPIIDQPLWEAAQRRLQGTRRGGSHALKNQYLLRGLIRCERCGRLYFGFTKTTCRSDNVPPRKYYYCSSIRKIDCPSGCGHPGLKGVWIEGVVWAEVEKLLADPQVVLTELERKRAEAGELSVYEKDLRATETALAALERHQDKLVDQYLAGLPRETMLKKQAEINARRTHLKTQKAELEAKVREARTARLDIEGITHFVEIVRQNLKTVTFEEKRLALEALRIEVRVGHDRVTIRGSIPLLQGLPVISPAW